MLSIKDTTSRTITEITIVVILSSVLYLHIYWSEFNIRVFEYANFYDVVVATGVLLVSSIMYGILGVMTSFLYTFHLNLEPGRGANTKIGQFSVPLLVTKKHDIRLHIKYVIIGIFFLLLLLIWYKAPQPNKRFFFPGFFALSFGTLIITIEYFNTKFLYEIKDYRARHLIMYILLSMLGSSFSLGEFHAEKILNNDPDILYDVKTGHKYLGHVNGYFFFITPDNSKIVIAKTTTYGELMLTTSKSKNDIQPPKPKNTDPKTENTDPKTENTDPKTENTDNIIEK